MGNDKYPQPIEWTVSRESRESRDLPVADSTGREADVIYDVLSERRRRHVLRCLQEYDESMTLADVADEVAVRELGKRITDISAETVMEIYLSLYHSHVPKLTAAGIVEYDQERDLVTTRNLEPVEPYLDMLEERDP